ncbi:ABC transporter permease [Halosimplex sp. J119]
MGYLRNRLLQAVITLYSIITLGFVFIRMMPGDPSAFLRSEIQQNPGAYGLPPNPTLEQINKVMQNQMNYTPGPIWEKYISYMQGAIGGDFGTSVIVDPGASNVQLILEAAPWTIFISSAGLVYALVAGIVFGSLMAYYEGTKMDVGLTVSMLAASSVPYYIVAILLLFLFSYNLEVFPTGGRFNTDTVPGFNYPFIAGVFNHAALPILSGITIGFGGNALSLRANSIRLLGEGHIRNAELRGLSTYTISTRYLARNAILPMYTGIVLGLAGLIGGSIILEEIFVYRGMGKLMYDATVQRDFPLMTTSLIFTTTIFVAGTLIADFTYSLIDPRAEQSSMG